MKAKFENNVLTVITPIDAATAEKGYAKLVAKDDKGNEMFIVKKASDGKTASLDEMGLCYNTIIDGKLACTMVMPMGTTREDVLKHYGKAILAGKKYTSQIAGTITAQTAEIESVLEKVAE